MKTLREVKRETYGHDHVSINRHSDRRYEDEKGMLYVLSRTLDGAPPFFEAYGPFSREHQGVLPRLRIAGKEYWGSGWTWRKAIMAFSREISGRIV